MTGPLRSGEPRDSSLNYGAIGATRTDEILQYPPKGYKAMQDTRRIGSGDERFEQAARALMTWGVQRGTGITVTDIEAENDETAYSGVDFDEEGRPVGRTSVAEEELFAPDGTPYVAAGTTALLLFKAGPATVRVPVKVVYIVDEPKKVGFAYGSRTGAPAEFERLMYLEQRDDGGVWFTIRSIVRPTTFWWRVALWGLRLGQRRYTTKYLTALHPTRTSGS